MSRKMKEWDELTESGKRGRVYRDGRLLTKEVTPEEQEERKKIYAGRLLKYYHKKMADPENRDEYNRKAREFREENREANRAYMAEYMRNYRKKQAEKKKLEKQTQIEEKNKSGE